MQAPLPNSEIARFGLSALGRVSSVATTTILVEGLNGRVGDVVKFFGTQTEYGEIIGIDSGAMQIMPYGPCEGFSQETFVLIVNTELGCLNFAAGHVVDGLGYEIDLDFSVQANPKRKTAPPITALTRLIPSIADRKPVNSLLRTGIKAVDVCTPLAKGQRIALMAPAGVGKSTLMTMMLRGVDADRIVLCLVGERGREALELIETLKHQKLLARAYVVVATSDKPSAERAKAPLLAMQAAESFAKQGLNVLVLVDSLTRYCRALREIALSLGEAPTRRGYPSSVFTALPRLLERGGAFTAGSITLVASVLVEDELMPDPIAEEVQSLSDGHIWLSRAMAARGHFPAIDIMKSISRLSNVVQTTAQAKVATSVRRALANNQQQEILLRMGEYRWGVDAALDADLKAVPKIMEFLAQPTGVCESLESAHAKIAKVFA